MTDGWVVAMIVSAGTVVVALSNIFKPITSIKTYIETRRAKNRLIHNAAMTAEDMGKRLDSIDKQLGQMNDRQQVMASDLKETIDHNRRQDAEIIRSLEQRRLHDSALFALLDASHHEGHDGPVTQARADLLEHMNREANSPIHRKD